FPGGSHRAETRHGLLDRYGGIGHSPENWYAMIDNTSEIANGYPCDHTYQNVFLRIETVLEAFQYFLDIIWFDGHQDDIVFTDCFFVVTGDFHTLLSEVSQGFCISPGHRNVPGFNEFAL